MEQHPLLRRFARVPKMFRSEGLCNQMAKQQQESEQRQTSDDDEQERMERVPAQRWLLLSLSVAAQRPTPVDRLARGSAVAAQVRFPNGCEVAMSKHSSKGIGQMLTRTSTGPLFCSFLSSESSGWSTLEWLLSGHSNVHALAQFAVCIHLNQSRLLLQEEGIRESLQ